MASTYLTRTFGSAGNQQIFTFSAWVKFSDDDNLNYIFSTGADAENRLVLLRHNSATGSTLKVDGKTSTVQTIEVRTNRAFRDVSAFYHIVLSVDTTQATASDRVKIYVNGVQETSFAQSTYPSQNYNTEVNKASTHYIGKVNIGTTYFDGSMTHVHFIDGTAYDASTFGETDATTGIWKPKTAPSVTYGTNGFFLKFENSGAFGTDSSGNGNNFTVNGTMTQTIDTPSNVFATLNTLHKGSGVSLSNGNNTYTAPSGSFSSVLSTLGFSSGKYYCEYKWVSGSNSHVGIANGDINLNTYLGAVGISYFRDGNKYNNNTSSTYGDAYVTGDIIGIALDLDNGAIWFSKNGTWQNSATITEIQNGTTTNAAFTGLSGEYFFGVGMGNSSEVANMNFGNGYFGTTAVASAQNPDDGIGIFEYSVPTGYKALCTKSINAQEYS